MGERSKESPDPVPEPGPWFLELGEFLQFENSFLFIIFLVVSFICDDNITIYQQNVRLFQKILLDIIKSRFDAT